MGSSSSPSVPLPLCHRSDGMGTGGPLAGLYAQPAPGLPLP